MPEEHGPDFRFRGTPKAVTEMAVDLTIAWLKRVESTADGRDPKEVVQALDEFYQAIQRHHETEMRSRREREPAVAH
jgi:hypothetical protein